MFLLTDSSLGGFFRGHGLLSGLGGSSESICPGFGGLAMLRRLFVSGLFFGVIPGPDFGHLLGTSF